jgi:hypothetical protein
MIRKNIALAAALTIALAAAAPASAMPRDGGRDPIQRVVKFIKHLFHSITDDEEDDGPIADPIQPHP